jgi:hypothetical protein
MLIQNLVKNLDRDYAIRLVEEQLGIKARIHNSFPELVCFKYDQIKSPKTNPLVQECRGLILDSSNDWAVVSRPFDRFFNAGESCAAEIDMSTAVAYEKLDGSLMTLYWYKDAWQVQSSGTPDAAGEISIIGKTFAQLFWDTWKSQSMVLPYCWTDYCFMFEMTSQYNKVVVQYQQPELRLIGVRSVTSGLELRPELAASTLGWDCVKSIELGSLADLVTKAAELNPLQLEGFVLCDHEFNRIKIKSPSYVALHRMAGGMTRLDCVKIVRTGEQAEIIAYFPEYATMLTEMRTRLLVTKAAVQAAWLEHEHLVGDKKAFAMAVKDLKVGGVMFSMAKTGWQDDWSDKLTDAQLLKLIGKA